MNGWKKMEQENKLRICLLCFPENPFSQFYFIFILLDSYYPFCFCIWTCNCGPKAKVYFHHSFRVHLLKESSGFCHSKCEITVCAIWLWNFIENNFCLNLITITSVFWLWSLDPSLWILINVTKPSCVHVIIISPLSEATFLLSKLKVPSYPGNQTSHKLTKTYILRHTISSVFLEHSHATYLFPQSWPCIKTKNKTKQCNNNNSKTLQLFLHKFFSFFFF